MKIKRAFWTCSAVIPATLVPLSIASCGCSQAWGYKTPLSIGTNIKGSNLDPYFNFDDETQLVDLDGNPIVSQLQSNYAIDTAHTTYYGYSLPQKWNSEKENPTVEPHTVWNKGGFEEGSAGWLDYSSGDFVKSNSITGTWDNGTEKKNISKTVYSYRNNTLSSNIELVSLIANSISQYLNYALQYQGTQIGTEYSTLGEADTNLGVAWGGTTLVHGSNIDDTVNRQFMESIFASNGVSGTSKYNATLRPSHIEFTFKDGFFPIVSYEYASGELKGVNEATKILLNGSNVRPSEASTKYYSAVTKDVEEEQFNFEKGTMDKYKYNIYTYTNVPVVVSFNGFVKSYVNPTINNSFMVSDFYSDAKSITGTIGDSWKESFPKFAGATAIAPIFKQFIYQPVDTHLTLTPAGADKIDLRIKDKLEQNDFVVLLNYSYKECTNAAGVTGDVTKPYDRVTMTGFSTMFPAYLCDTNLKVLDEKESIFKVIKEEQGYGYTFNTDVINKYANLLLEIYKRTTGQGLVVHAKDLNDTSKKLLKFLAYMFGDNTLAVDTSKILTAIDLDK